MIFLAFVLIGIVLLYLYNVRTFNYWTKRGVKHVTPMVFVGSTLDVYLQKKSVTQLCAEIYVNHPKEKIVGMFWSTKPVLVIRDPNIIKSILIADFYHFYKRGVMPGNTLEPLLRNLFFAEGDLWRLLRQRLTPAFTSGKLKAMFPLITERAENLRTRTLNAALEGRALDARDLMARYTTDFIGACGFGLDANSLNDEDSAFRKLGADIFHFGLRENLKLLIKDMFPNFTDNIKFFDRLEDKIIDLVIDIQKQRNYQPSKRNDFIDLMLECKKKGKIVGDSIENFNKNGSPKGAEVDLDDVIMAAQVFVFFAAGFETSSSATSYTLHQLAYYPEVQKKVQKEIDTVLTKYDDKLSYDAIKEMTYLEWTFKEALRLFPSLGFLIRTCVKPYTIPEVNVPIDKEVRVIIPVQALHTDPQYWNKPDEFRPERFHPDEFNDVAKSIYMPFGEGPRSCIGERLGLMQSLAGLAAVLSRFTVEPAPETKRYPSVETRADIVQAIDGGLPLMFRQRKKQ
ncbi:cytochrome P450 6B6-like [Plodia interpunctella]|uniref:cytochrome P450 6B6-like n=1 Tax=Plodia interpunctella TaxID=58824 RepID=UPI002368B7D2|nr:cytochrome P450 6B6-like [Plodia interpunctella]